MSEAPDKTKADTVAQQAAAPDAAKRNVLADLIKRIEQLQRLMDVDRKQGSFPIDHETARRVTEASLIVAECAVHGLGLLAEMAQYQRVQAETAAIALQMRQMAKMPMKVGPGGLFVPSGG